VTVFGKTLGGENPPREHFWGLAKGLVGTEGKIWVSKLTTGTIVWEGEAENNNNSARFQE
jgi:hypothetical protein